MELAVASVGPEEPSAGLAAADRAVVLARGPVERAQLQLRLVRLLRSTDREDDALVLFRAVSLADLPRAQQCDYHQLEAALLRRRDDFDGALAALARALPMAVTTAARRAVADEQWSVRAAQIFYERTRRK